MSSLRLTETGNRRSSKRVFPITALRGAFHWQEQKTLKMLGV
jgi:hypothetical protein